MKKTSNHFNYKEATEAAGREIECVEKIMNLHVEDDEEKEEKNVKDIESVQGTMIGCNVIDECITKNGRTVGKQPVLPYIYIHFNQCCYHRCLIISTYGYS